VIGALLLSWTVASQQPRDTLRLCAVGDLNLDRRVAGAGLQGDTLYPFRALLESLRGADITFGNLESPIASDASPVPDSGAVFAAPPVAAMALARAGFDIVSTANNHAWDGGQPAAEETMRQLTRAGVRFVGSGFGRDMAEQPVILERRGWRVAFFAVTRAWNPAPYSFYKHAGANWVAWGDTTWIYPRGKPIVQSLGNFVFVQSDPRTQLSAILRVAVAPDHRMRVSAVPVRVGPQPTVATGTAADSVRRRLRVRLSTPIPSKP